MRIFSKLKDMDKVYSWSFLGFIIGFVGIIFAIYSVYFIKAEPNLQYQIITNTDVIDMREEVNNMTILFNNRKIEQEKNKLKIITFKVVNNGDEDIRLGDFDPNAPVGFNIKNGEIVDLPRIISASNDYLYERIKINKEGENYTFPQFILESKNEFVVKILVMSSNNSIPNIVSIGKIAGIDKIKVITQTDDNKQSIISKSFYGDIWIQLIRLLAYSISTLFIFAGVIVSSSLIGDAISASSRKRIVNKYKKSKTYREDNNYYKVIFDLYLKHNIRSLERVKSILKDKEKLTNIIENKKNTAIHGSEIINEYTSFDIMDFNMRYDYGYAFNNIIKELVEQMIIEKKGDEYLVNQKFIKAFDHFSEYALMLE